MLGQRIEEGGITAHGEIAGSATAAVCPSVAAKFVRFKATVSNAGDVYLGISNAVTVADGTTDVTTGFELNPGDDTGWLPCTNVNNFWRICDNAGDDLVYWAIT